jgi:hypothetical protein
MAKFLTVRVSDLPARNRSEACLRPAANLPRKNRGADPDSIECCGHGVVLLFYFSLHQTAA